MACLRKVRRSLNKWKRVWRIDKACFVCPFDVFERSWNGVLGENSKSEKGSAVSGQESERNYWNRFINVSKHHMSWHARSWLFRWEIYITYVVNVLKANHIRLTVLNKSVWNINKILTSFSLIISWSNVVSHILPNMSFCSKLVDIYECLICYYWRAYNFEVLNLNLPCPSACCVQGRST